MVNGTPITFVNHTNFLNSHFFILNSPFLIPNLYLAVSFNIYHSPLKSVFSNLWRVPQSIFILKKFYKTQQAYTLPFLKPIFDKIPNEIESLSKAEWRRIKDYPMLFIVLFVELFAELRKKPLSDTERARLTLFSASLAVYDDFFDNSDLDGEYILEIYQNPKKIKLRILHLLQQIRSSLLCPFQ